MAIFENILAPIFTVVILMFFGLGILFLIYKGLQFLFEDMAFWIKYKVLKRDYDEEIVFWCMDMIKQRKPQDELKKILYLEGKKKREMNEILYIWRNIIQLKGGIKNVR